MDTINSLYPPTAIHFHSFIPVEIYNKDTGEEGWRIVGVWGDVEKKEGHRIGPVFDTASECSEAIKKLEAKCGGSAPIDDTLDYFNRQKLRRTTEELKDALLKKLKRSKYGASTRILCNHLFQEHHRKYIVQPGDSRMKQTYGYLSTLQKKGLVGKYGPGHWRYIDDSKK